MSFLGGVWLFIFFIQSGLRENGQAKGTTLWPLLQLIGLGLFLISLKGKMINLNQKIKNTLLWKYLIPLGLVLGLLF